MYVMILRYFDWYEPEIKKLLKTYRIAPRHVGGRQAPQNKGQGHSPYHALHSGARGH